MIISHILFLDCSTELPIEIPTNQFRIVKMISWRTKIKFSTLKIPCASRKITLLYLLKLKPRDFSSTNYNLSSTGPLTAIIRPCVQCPRWHVVRLLQYPLHSQQLKARIENGLDNRYTDIASLAFLSSCDSSICRSASVHLIDGQGSAGTIENIRPGLDVDSK